MARVDDNFRLIEGVDDNVLLNLTAYFTINILQSCVIERLSIIYPSIAKDKANIRFAEIW